MQHLDDGVLHALVDGEVPSAELGPIQAHLDGCADCRSRLDEARNMAGESNALIELIEVPAAHEVSPAAAPRMRRPAATWIRPLGLAASLALAVGLGYAGAALQHESGAALQRRAAAPMASRIDTVFVAQDRAAAVEQTVPAPETVSPAPSQEPAAGRRDLARAKEEREQADERQTTPAAPAEADQVRQVAPSAQASRDSALAQRFRSSQVRLEELVVTGAAESSQRRLAGNQARDLKDSTGARDAQLKRQESETKRANNEGAAKSLAAAPPAQLSAIITTMQATPITFYQATTLLGGQLRLIDGMVPIRLEMVGTAVRVVYPLERGELVLEQRREADSLAVVLIGPTLSPDSLGKLRQKIR
jgi:hypothetical protein